MKYADEIRALQTKQGQSGFESSTFEKALEKTLVMTQNLSQVGVVAGYEGK